MKKKMAKVSKKTDKKRMCKRCLEMFMGGKYSKVCPKCTIHISYRKRFPNQQVNSISNGR